MTGRIDDLPAIDRADHAMHLSLPCVDGNFGHLRVEAADVVDDRDAAAMTGRQRLAPTGLFGRQIQHAQQARRFRQQVAAELDRIFPGGAAISSRKLSVKKVFCE